MIKNGLQRVHVSAPLQEVEGKAVPEIMTSPGLHSGILLLDGHDGVVNLLPTQEPSKLTHEYKLIRSGKGLKEYGQSQAHFNAPIIPAFRVLESDVASLKVDVLPLQKSDLLPSGSRMGEAIDKRVHDGGAMGFHCL